MARSVSKRDNADRKQGNNRRNEERQRPRREEQEVMPAAEQADHD